MTREQAMELMMTGAFQQEREAAGKWLRAQLSSVQLLSYYTGFEEHMALREEAKRRWGNQFTLRRYNDEAHERILPALLWRYWRPNKAVAAVQDARP